MNINRRKLAVIMTVPIFFGLGAATNQWRLIESTPNAYSAGRWEYSDNQYAKERNTTVEAIRAAESKACERTRDQCVTEELAANQPCKDASCTSERKLWQFLCSCDMPAVLQMPDDDLATHAAGTMSAARHLSPLLSTLLLAAIASWALFVILPLFATRLWRWLHV